ncbi:MAG: DUF4121 family protein [Bacteroidales bacterium]|nr:DUF4121 family protein [Bacteroidales bacterium]
MTAERLIEINKDRYLLVHKLNEEDYGKIQNVMDLLSFHHCLSDKPKVGDLVEGAYYDGACPYHSGRIEKIEGDEVVICCKPFIPFVSFHEGKIHLSMSGGPFITQKISELVPVRDDKAQYKFWGHVGACANGAIAVETQVKRWKVPYEKIPSSYVSEVDEVSLERNPIHNSKVILHIDHMFFFARYRSMKQLQDLADLMGFTFTLDEESSRPGFRMYNMSHQIVTGRLFWNTDVLPKEAKPFMGFSNGNLCTCYFVRDDDNKEIVIYEPNPNSKQVYDAMDIHSQINYVSEHGKAGPKFS